MNRVAQFLPVRTEAVSQAKLRILLGLYDDPEILDAAMNRLIAEIQRDIAG